MEIYYSFNSVRHIISINLGNLLGLDIPLEIIGQAAQSLDEKIAAGQLRGGLAYGFAQDLHIHVTTHNSDLDSTSPGTIAMQAALEACLKALRHAQDIGLTSDGGNQTILEESTDEVFCDIVDPDWVAIEYTWPGTGHFTVLMALRRLF